jgi:hypothetical protein
VDENLLESRYGRSGVKKRDRIFAVTVAVLALLAFLAWALWFTISDANRVTHRDVAYEIVDEYSAKVTFEVTRQPGQSVVCSVKVLNQAFAIVGYKTVEIAPSTARSQVIITNLNTTELGVSGLVDRCS